ncbi:MAG TPA: hypothetical protein VGF92_07355 [Stellaceae bacterium]|jgi:hypothetical protein
MTITHKLVGYDKQSERVAAEYDVPEQKFDLVRRIVGVSHTDREAIGNYPLAAPAAEEVAKEIGLRLDTKRLDFFLEPAV